MNRVLTGVALLLVVLLSWQPFGLGETTTDQKSRPISVWMRLLRIAGVNITPPTYERGGPGEPKGGEIWIAMEGTQKKLTEGGDYRSPVFDINNQYVLSLNGDQLVRIPVDGSEPSILHTVSGLEKLVGISMTDPDKILALQKVRAPDGGELIGLLSLKSGTFEQLDWTVESDYDEYMPDHLEDWNRDYGVTKLYVVHQRKFEDLIEEETIPTDVYQQYKNGPRNNISKCHNARCGQPSLSHDGRSIVYVRHTL